MRANWLRKERGKIFILGSESVTSIEISLFRCSAKNDTMSMARGSPDDQCL